MPADGAAKNLLWYAQQLVSDPSMEADRAEYGLPAVPVSQVRLVQDPSTCAQAARAFEHATGDHGKLDRQVYVVQAGTAYIVLGPNERAGEFQVHIIFDQHWKRLASFAS